MGTGFEAVRLIGRTDERTHNLRDAFSRNHIPIGYYAADTEAGRRMLDALGLDQPELPVLVLEFTAPPTTLINPSDIEIADAFGLMTPPSADRLYDVIVIGAGPAGLAAAVYAASEGLSTLVIERQAVGGQAGTSSLIRNYPGFSRGISGAHLAFRSFQQAWSFGAEFLFMRDVVGLTAGDGERAVSLSDGNQVRGRSIIVATGVDYRRLGIDDLEEMVGRGVYYGAAVSEAPAMAGKPVFVVGGGNSAGQAALAPRQVRPAGELARAWRQPLSEHVRLPDRPAPQHRQRGDPPPDGRHGRLGRSTAASTASRSRTSTMAAPRSCRPADCSS